MSRTTRTVHHAAHAVGSGTRTAAHHPRAAASGVGIGGSVVVALAGLVLVRLARSRRVQHAATRCAERGVFGPGVATATRVAKRARQER